MDTPQAFIGSCALSLLYLWLSLAYTLAAKRTGARLWWLQTLAWLNWIFLFLLNLSAEDEQFELFPQAMSAVLLATPLILLAPHLSASLVKGVVWQQHMDAAHAVD